MCKRSETRWVNLLIFADKPPFPLLLDIYGNHLILRKYFKKKFLPKSYTHPWFWDLISDTVTVCTGTLRVTCLVIAPVCEYVYVTCCFQWYQLDAHGRVTDNMFSICTVVYFLTALCAECSLLVWVFVFTRYPVQSVASFLINSASTSI